MKKILVIRGMPKDTIGGEQKYSNKIIEIFMDKYCIHELTFIYSNNYSDTNREFFFNLSNKKFFKKIISKIIGADLHSRIKIKKYISLLEKKNKYDIILACSTSISIPKNVWKKTIAIQHIDNKIIDAIDTYLNIKSPIIKFIKNFLKHFLYLKTCYINAKIIIAFTEFNITEFKKNKKYKNKIFFSQPLFYDGNFLKSNNFKKIYKYLYIGRIENKQKNINFLLQLSSKLNDQIHLIGPNEKNINIYEYEKINYLGIKKSQEIIDIISKTEFLILSSNYEGLPFVCIEALSNGVPLILKDSFITAKFLINENKNGFLFRADESLDSVADTLNNLDWLSFNQNDIVSFAKSNFSLDSFAKNWDMFLQKL